jgi:hypothetical protein
MAGDTARIIGTVGITGITGITAGGTGISGKSRERGFGPFLFAGATNHMMTTIL